MRNQTSKRPCVRFAKKGLIIDYLRTFLAQASEKGRVAEERRNFLLISEITLENHRVNRSNPCVVVVAYPILRLALLVLVCSVG